MTEIVTLEWSYVPADFFEEAVEYREKTYAIEIKEGRITATLSVPEEQALPFNEIHEDLETRFLAAQLFNNKSHHLSEYTVRRIQPDGSANIEAGILVGATLRMSVGTVDVVVRDAAGNIESDTRRDRIEETNKLMALASKHRKEPVVGSLLKSYSAAIADPQNALIHLYEIRDALDRAEFLYHGE